MRKSFGVAILAVALFLTACGQSQQGPKGEQGPPGPQGSKGDQGLPLAAWLACRKSRDSTWCDRRGSSLSGAFASGRRLCRITGQSELFPFHDAFVSEAFSD
jgi:hypothetical protein